MTDQNQNEQLAKTYTREDVATLVGEIEKEMAQGQNVLMHSMLLLNELFRQPNCALLLDDDLQRRIKDIWQKVKLAGLKVNDPPLLFGQPEVATAEVVTSDNIDDGTSAIIFKLPPEEEPKSKKAPKKEKRRIEEDLEEDLEDEETEDDEDSSVEEE